MFGKYEVELGEVGTKKVVVNGQDLTGQVRALSIHAAPFEPSILILEGVAPGVIQGEGVIQIATPSGFQSAIDLIKELNADEIEGRALDAYADEFEGRLTPALLKALLELLSEAESQLNR